MDKNLLKEKKLYEAHKQFMRLCEWSYVPQSLEEDDDENNQDNNAPMDDNAQMGDNGNMNQDMPMDGNDSMGNMPMGNDTESMQNDMENGQMEPMDGQGMGEEPMMGTEAMPPMGDNMMDNEDETVIDVDDITNAQEKMNDKVNVVGQDLGKVDDKIETLLQSLNNMQAMINNNNEEIAKFKAEFEKRNPTQTEKLNLRSLDSYPFNVNPKDYWAQKGADPNSNYSGFSNNGEPTTQEYVITNNDVDDFSEREIEDSFDIEDELKQDINKIFGI